MFKMSSTFPITGSNSPSVTLHYQLTISQCNHWLNRNTQATLYHCTITTPSIIRNLRILMHVLPYTMSHKFTNNAIGLRLTILLYCISDITQSFSRNRILYSKVQSVLGGLQQLHYFWCDFTYTKRICRIATKTIHISATINRNNITLTQNDISWNSMHDLLINRSTNRSRKRTSIWIWESLKGRNSTIISNKLFRNLIQFFGCSTRPNDFSYFCQSLPYK